MKWTNDEINTLKDLYARGCELDEISEQLNRTYASVKSKRKTLKLKRKLNNKVTNNCENCGDVFESYISENRKYCSSSCAARVNNVKFPKKIKNVIKCKNCDEDTSNEKYCSSKCHREFEYTKRVDEWLNGHNPIDKSGNVSKFVKRYLIETRGEKCEDCGWKERNPYTGNVPIELEHIDGDSGNNIIENLKLLCPNCHSLTPTYKALNTGNGRHSRRQRYKEGKSF